MRRLRVRKIARAEILAAFEWYLERSPAAAERFLAAVDDGMRRIDALRRRRSATHSFVGVYAGFFSNGSRTASTTRSILP